MNLKCLLLSYFVICLTREQSKLQQLDALSSSTNQSLLAHTSKGKKKDSYKKKKYYAQGGETPSKPQ
jgi:hypothetical protein